VRRTRVWAGLLGLRRVVVEDVQFGSEDEIVVAVRPVWRELDRCGVCRRRSPGFDLGDGRRRWRALDLGTTLAFVEAQAPRVTCRRHGVVVCAVPWARHTSRFTRAFEDQTVRHEALLNRVGCRAPPPGCRSSPVKLGAA
jgi:transposase